MEDITPIHHPRRHRKTPTEIFKEAYLPYLILLFAIVLIIVFIIGAVSRANDPQSVCDQAAYFSAIIWEV